ncbi:hypothetical protein ES703_17169 [subsurface metagenome]
MLCRDSVGRPAESGNGWGTGWLLATQVNSPFTEPNWKGGSVEKAESAERHFAIMKLSLQGCFRKITGAAGCEAFSSGVCGQNHRGREKGACSASACKNSFADTHYIGASKRKKPIAAATIGLLAKGKHTTSKRAKQRTEKNGG